MTRKRMIDQRTIDCIAQNMFLVMPMLKKRLLHLDIVQAEHGIPLSHVQVLSMLSEMGSMSVSEISRRLGIAKPNITPLVDRLIEYGLVERLRDGADRRVVNIIILDEGKKKLDAIQTSVAEQVRRWVLSMPASDARELNTALTSISRILNDMSK